jgi:hypothetical protein
VVVVAAGVVADWPLLVPGQTREVAEHVLDLAVGPLGSLQSGVRFVDVGLVMLVMVNPHRRLVDVGLERVIRVRKVGNRKGHLASPLVDIQSRGEPNAATLCVPAR